MTAGSLSLPRAASVQTKSLAGKVFNNPRLNAERILTRLVMLYVLVPNIFDYIPPIVPVLLLCTAAELLPNKIKGV
jgi:hypothetical protein